MNFKGAKKLLMKLPLVLFCIGGFTYQATSFLSIYWSYPSVVDIQVTKPFEFALPAITMCIPNSVRRSVFCNKYPDQCSKPKNETEFCSTFPHHCDEGQMGEDFMMMKDFRIIFTKKRQELKEMGHQYEDMMKQCLIIDLGKITDCKENFNTSSIIFPSGPANCYSLFTSYGQPNRVPQKINTFNGWLCKSSTSSIQRIPTQLMINLILAVEPQEHVHTDLAFGIFIAVHNPIINVNPLIDGKFFEMNTQNLVAVTEVKRHLLPAPFESNCTDYIAQWKNRNGRGPVSREMCIQECALNITMKKSGCADRRIHYPHWEELCTQEFPNFTGTVILPCTERCLPACFFDEYFLFVTTGQAPGSQHHCVDPKVNKICNSVSVTFLFNKMEVTTYKFKPQYQEIEIFSYVGGYVGIWLGVSLCSIFNILHSFLENRKCRMKTKKKTSISKKTLAPNRAFRCKGINEIADWRIIKV